MENQSNRMAFNLKSNAEDVAVNSVSSQSMATSNCTSTGSTQFLACVPGEGGLVPSMGYIGMCSPRVGFFKAVLFILCSLVLNSYSF